jgi:hypothetical protein
VSAYLEFHVKGNRRAYIDAGGILGVLTSPNMNFDTVATPQAPVSVLLRAGETIEVIGQSAGLIMLRAKIARERLKAEGKLVLIDYLEPLDEAKVEE